MEKIHVVVDSTANVPAELFAKYPNLHKTSLKLMLGAQEWAEDDIRASQLFDEMARVKAFPKTSQPPLGAFIQLFEKIINDGGRILVLTVSGALSGTVQGANAAARSVDEANIKVVDTQTTAAGMLNMALQAIKLAESGATLEQLVMHCKKVVSATHTIILTDSLEYLHKGGRIGGASALFGTLLQIKPILYLQEGKIAVLDKVRTRSRAIDRMLRELAKSETLEYISVVHSGGQAEAQQVKIKIQAMNPEVDISVSEVGSALAAHVGPNAFALIYQEKIEP